MTAIVRFFAWMFRSERLPEEESDANELPRRSPLGWLLSREQLPLRQPNDDAGELSLLSSFLRRDLLIIERIIPSFRHIMEERAEAR